MFLIIKTYVDNFFWDLFVFPFLDKYENDLILPNLDEFSQNTYPSSYLD